jgi:hypothetical protein
LIIQPQARFAALRFLILSPAQGATLRFISPQDGLLVFWHT